VVPGRTRRFFAAPDWDARLIYAIALLALLEYVRTSGEEFIYGPTDLAAAVAGGLVLSGPGLAGPAAVLSGIPGLVEHDPEEEPAGAARLAPCDRVGGPGR